MTAVATARIAASSKLSLVQQFSDYIRRQKDHVLKSIWTSGQDTLLQSFLSSRRITKILSPSVSDTSCTSRIFARAWTEGLPFANTR